jgi:hypothetical protein
MTRIFIEDNELDISQSLTNQITYAIDDLRNLDSKSTSFTKTIIIPGTANNNKIFGNIFEFNNANFYDESYANVLSNFNAMVNAYARIEVNGLQIMKGHLRLLEIIRDGNGVEYECAIIGELGSFINTLGNLRLEDLDFSDYNHNYTSDNITQSWEVSGTRGANNSTGYGSGYFYPLIDYGANSTNKIDFKLNTFRPSFFVKQYIDKMFEYTDYTYDSTFFNTSFFKSLLIPNNQKEFSKKSSTAFSVEATGGTFTNEDEMLVSIPFSIITTLGNFTANGTYDLFTYNSATPLTGSINLLLRGGIDFDVPGYVTFKVLKNGEVIATQITNQTMFNLSIVINEVSFALNDTLQIVWSGPIQSGLYTTLYIYGVNSILINSVAVYVPFNHNDSIFVNDTIPKGIFLKDFFTSIMKMFNLLIVEDKTKQNHLIIEPYQNFFSGLLLDWSDKIDRSKPIKIKPMSELNARYYNLKYTEDNDFYNENYKKVFNEGYADRVYDTAYEFSKDTENVQVIFAPSIMIKATGTDKVYPAIYKLSNNNSVEDRMDSKIRIGMVKKITGVSTWHIKKQDGSGNWSAALTAYGYFGHVDNPTTPTIDINFGAPLEIFFTPTSYPPDNLFNTYYSGYIDEITNKDSRLLTGYFKLNEIDIYNLDFSKYIFIDGGLYKISRVIDYEAGANDLTKVELLRVIDRVATSSTTTTTTAATTTTTSTTSTTTTISSTCRCHTITVTSSNATVEYTDCKNLSVLKNIFYSAPGVYGLCADLYSPSFISGTGSITMTGGCSDGTTCAPTTTTTSTTSTTTTEPTTTTTSTTTTTTTVSSTCRCHTITVTSSNATVEYTNCFGTSTLVNIFYSAPGVYGLCADLYSPSFISGTGSITMTGGCSDGTTCAATTTTTTSTTSTTTTEPTTTTSTTSTTTTEPTTTTTSTTSTTTTEPTTTTSTTTTTTTAPPSYTYYVATRCDNSFYQQNFRTTGLYVAGISVRYQGYCWEIQSIQGTSGVDAESTHISCAACNSTYPTTTTTTTSTTTTTTTASCECWTIFNEGDATGNYSYDRCSDGTTFNRNIGSGHTQTVCALGGTTPFQNSGFLTIYECNTPCSSNGDCSPC